MRNVAAPINPIVHTSVVLRPSLSPKCPKTTLPTGRAKNPTAYVANAFKAPDCGLESGKNSRGMTSAAAVP